MGVEVRDRALDAYRHAKGSKKTELWRKHKDEIIVQGLRESGRRRQAEEHVNRTRGN